MNNTTVIKLGGITNLSDARYAAAIGVQYIGFCFDPFAASYIPPVKAKEIMDWLSGCFFVGEFNGQSSSEIQDICDLLGIHIIEAGADEIPAGYAVIRKLDVTAYSQNELTNIIDSYAPFADAFHLFSSTSDYDQYNPFVKSLCEKYKIIWGFNLNDENVVRVKNEYAPYALNLNGGTEEKPGLKDFDQLESILSAIGFLS